MRLSLHQVEKSYGGKRVLGPLSSDLVESRTLVLLGPSGCGKSTLLRLLGGLERPDAGSIALNGKALSASERELRHYRTRIGTVFQSFNLFPHLTALRNITLPLEKVHRLPPAAARERAEKELRRFRLLEHAMKRPMELSGGQRQRVAIARALATDPQLMLFDEPTSALDPEMTYEVLDAIAQLKEEGRDLVLVTHQMAFARQVGEHVWFLREGQIVESASASVFFSSPQNPGAQDFLARILRY